MVRRPVRDAKLLYGPDRVGSSNWKSVGSCWSLEIMGSYKIFGAFNVNFVITFLNVNILPCRCQIRECV